MARILIADDERDVVGLVEFILTREGYEVFVASNGSDAVQLATTKLPNLIILDVMMPDMDGYAVREELLAQESTRQIPIIFLTVVTHMQESSDTSQKAPVILQKPFEPKALLSLVRETLNKNS